jgi:hypothetical protein
VLRRRWSSGFEREVARGREDPPKNLEEFKHREALENTGNAAGQQLDATMALADAHILNDGTLDDLKERVSGLLEVHDAKT